MKKFNLSQWAITHRALVLFMILILGGAGTYSYFNLGRALQDLYRFDVVWIDVGHAVRRGNVAVRHAGGGVVDRYAVDHEQRRVTVGPVVWVDDTGLRAVADRSAAEEVRGQRNVEQLAPGSARDDLKSRNSIKNWMKVGGYLVPRALGCGRDRGSSQPHIEARA